MNSKSFSVVVVGLSFLVGVANCLAAEPNNAAQVLEQRLGTMGLVFDSAKSATIDGCHLAWAEQRGTEQVVQVVVVDGKAGPEYDGILMGSLVLSPDGKRVAYKAIKGSKSFVVVDGQAGPEYGEIEPGSLVFSADGKRVAYNALPEFNIDSLVAIIKGSQRLVVVDGQVGSEHNRGVRVVYGRLGGDIAFSHDGKRVAYTAGKGNKWFVVVDGQTGPQYDQIICGPVFLKDGTVEYLAMKGSSVYRVQSRP